MRSRLAGSAVLVLVSTVCAAPLMAQMAPPAHFETWRPPPSERIPLTSSSDSSRPAANGSGMVLGGVTGFVLGYVVGGAIGAAAYRGGDSDSYDQLGAAVFGGAIMSSIAIPVGVHLGNRGRGKLVNSLLPSLAIGGIGIAVAVGSDNGIPLLVMPLAQIIASVWTESNSMPKPIPLDASP
jgi:hypothetical protein